jgi:alpha-L-rhamnosidase
VLCRFGYEDLAFALLNQEHFPSWLYEVHQGATTVWEAWDAKRPDGRLRKGYSFNHYAFGAIGDWLYRHVAGLQPDESQPGFKRILLAPHPGGGLDWARASHQSPYGEVSVAWRRDQHGMQVTVDVPPNTTAEIMLSQARAESVEEDGTPLNHVRGIKEVASDDHGTRLTVGSGRYCFRYPVVDRRYRL